MKAVEIYLRDLYQTYQAVPEADESAYHLPLNVLLDEVGQTVRPRVRCRLSLKNSEAGLPLGGLFTAAQLSGADAPPAETRPARGAVEIRSIDDELSQTAHSLRVVKHLKQYGQVLVTNYRSFVLVGLTAEGQPVSLESYSLADNPAAFWALAAQPKVAAKQHGRRLTNYLHRMLTYAAPPTGPDELIPLLAAYARESLARIDDALAFVGTAHEPLRQALDTIRVTLESSLGLAFEGSKGDRLFRASLVQTLFYALFAAWLLWHEEAPGRQDRFSWRMIPWHLRLPLLRALLDQLEPPEISKPGGLEEVLDWASRALSRVDRAQFFAQFDPDQIIPDFCEPFLHAFSPRLEKWLGVGATPPAVARYMVRQVDTRLRTEVGLAEGLADEQLYLLDPGCGSGTYLIEALTHLAELPDEDEERRLRRLKRAATHRFIGFEITPAAYVIAHLRLTRLLEQLGVPVADDERAAVYLTNALTGWEAPNAPVTPSELALTDFQTERDAANALKRGRKFGAILGTPPPTAISGLTLALARDLTKPYAASAQEPPADPQAAPYLPFLRLAERQIVEQNKKGVISYLTPYTWLAGAAFQPLRAQYATAFDQIWVDCLNGDKDRNGKLTPDGRPDPSIFATPLNRRGIATGTAITTLVRRPKHKKAKQIEFRDVWGEAKGQQLLDATEEAEEAYEALKLRPKTGLPFMPPKVAPDYFDWPLLPKIFPVSFPGLKTNRDNLLIDIDREALVERMQHYFNPALSQEQLAEIAPQAVEQRGRFDGLAVRTALQGRGFLPEQVVRYCYRPFDLRWLYWEPEQALLAYSRPAYAQQIFNNSNLWLEARPRQRTAHFDRGYITNLPADSFGQGVSRFFPLYLVPQDTQLSLFRPKLEALQPNLSQKATVYLEEMESGTPYLFYHTVAILHAPAYRRENSGALRQNWPRVPLPDSETRLRKSAILGRKVAMLLNPDVTVAEVTTRRARADLQIIAVLSRADGEPVDPDELALSAGWGRLGRNDRPLPGPGQMVERPYTPAERAAIEKGAATLGFSLDQVDGYFGQTTYDVYLNETTYWANIPPQVWSYTAGGYPVLKKWLSYRAVEVLGRSLKRAEAQEVTQLARRIAALLLLSRELDGNYGAVKKGTYGWRG